MASWHGSVGWTLTGKNGDYCGYIGLAYPCDSYEDGIKKGIEWLRKPMGRSFEFLTRTFDLKVRYF